MFINYCFFGVFSVDLSNVYLCFKNGLLYPHSEIEDYLRTAKVEVVNEEAKARKKRSVEPFDFFALHKPSRFLEQHNVGYRIKVPTNYPSKNSFS